MRTPTIDETGQENSSDTCAVPRKKAISDSSATVHDANAEEANAEFDLPNQHTNSAPAPQPVTEAVVVVLPAADPQPPLKGIHKGLKRTVEERKAKLGAGNAQQTANLQATKEVPPKPLVKRGLMHTVEERQAKLEARKNPDAGNKHSLEEVTTRSNRIRSGLSRPTMTPLRGLAKNRDQAANAAPSHGSRENSPPQRESGNEGHGLDIEDFDETQEDPEDVPAERLRSQEQVPPSPPDVEAIETAVGGEFLAVATIVDADGQPQEQERVFVASAVEEEAILNKLCLVRFGLMILVCFSVLGAVIAVLVTQLSGNSLDETAAIITVQPIVSSNPSSTPNVQPSASSNPSLIPSQAPSTSTVELFGRTYARNRKRIVLRQSGWTFGIPSELGQLTALAHLELSENDMSGSIPTELGHLTALTYLDFHRNVLSGPIPTELGCLTALTYLDLNWGDALSGTIPTQFGLLYALEYLEAYWNQLEGSIPSELGAVTSMTALHLGKNHLSGILPNELGKMSALVYFQIFGDRLVGPIPSQLGQWTAMKNADFSGNKLSGMVPTELGQMHSCEWLGLDRNQLVGSIPSELGKLSVLRHLGLNGNQLTGMIPTELGKMSALKQLDLHDNLFLGSTPSEICLVASLEELIVDCAPDPFPLNCSCGSQCTCQ